MSLTRRDYLLGSASVALLSMPQSATAQISEGAKELRDVFGLPNYRAPTADLQFLKSAQEQRIAAPREPNAFGDYLTRLPLVQKITAGIGPDLYHLIQWNALALDLTAQDHTTIGTADGKPDKLYAEQFGPHRSSRALAIIHLAIFEAVNTIYRKAQSYKGVQTKIFAAIGRKPQDVDEHKASVRAAIAVAAHDTMLALYPQKAALVEAQFRQLVPTIPDSPEMQGIGTAIGEAAAAQILALRKYDPSTKQFSDGSETDGKVLLKRGDNNSLDLEPTAALLFPSPTIDDWRVDPITAIPKAIGGYWQHVEPFVLDPKQLFLPPDFPKATSAEFQKAYDDVRGLGGDPAPPAINPRHPTHTSRTGTSAQDALDEKNETFKGYYWAYDGTALLCAPPRMYNMITTSIALNEHKIEKVEEMARYLAIVNIVLADCGIAAWTAKYKYHLARPITWIRLHDPDKVIDSTANKDWTPLGAPADNAGPTSANLTPPFPAYPSGHAVFGGGLFQVLRKFHGDLKFSFVSDEYNGLNRGPTGDTRPKVERTFQSLTDAEKENGRSRIWLGIHWQFDADSGIKQGNSIADYVMANALQPI